MPRSPGNRVAFFYVFNYVCTNLAIAFWKEGGERDIWQKAFTFVLSFSKEIFPLASPCFTVKQENLCTTTMQFLNAICSMGFLSSSDNLKLSLFPKMQQQNQGISMQYLYTVQYLTEFSNVFWTSSERIVQTFFLQEAARSQWQSRHLCPHFWFRSGIKKTIAPIVVTNDSKISFWAKTESQKWHFYDRRRRYHCLPPHHLARYPVLSFLLRKNTKVRNLVSKTVCKPPTTFYCIWKMITMFGLGFSNIAQTCRGQNSEDKWGPWLFVPARLLRSDEGLCSITHHLKV